MTTPEMRSGGGLTKLRRLAGIDRAVGFAILGRGWGAGAGIITLGFLIRFLTAKQQGYYSTFGSFMALQVFFELGLSLVLMQFASHERAGLEWTPQRTLEGDPVAKARLASLLRRGMLWYGLMSLAVLALIYPVGWAYFSRYGLGGAPVAWQGPWLFLSVCVAGGLLFTPLWAVLEGAGLVAEVVAAQLVGGIVNSLLFWLMLFLHWGLYAAPLGGLASTAWVIGWLAVRQRGFLLDLWGAARPNIEVSWRHEIWPFQWKIALSWLAGYFISQTFCPLLFALHGPVRGPILAGQMGVSLRVTTAISAIALGWVVTKAAPFGSLVARRDWERMDRMFFPCLWQSTSVLILGEAAFWLLRLGLRHGHGRLDGRLLDPLPLGLLMGATVVSHIAAAQSIYLRAHKQEPFLLPSLLGGGLVSLSSLLLCRPFGVTGMMAAYLAISLAVGLGLGTAIFVRKRREWHAESPGTLEAPGDWPPAPLLAEPETTSR